MSGKKIEGLVEVGSSRRATCGKRLTIKRNGDVWVVWGRYGTRKNNLGTIAASLSLKALKSWCKKEGIKAS